jgi:hypothetical protein
MSAKTENKLNLISEYKRGIMSMRLGSISKVLCWPQVFCSVSSRIFNGFRRGFAVSVFIDFLNYKNKLCLLYTTKSGYTERGKTAHCP